MKAVEGPPKELRRTPLRTRVDAKSGSPAVADSRDDGQQNVRSGRLKSSLLDGTIRVMADENQAQCPICKKIYLISVQVCPDCKEVLKPKYNAYAKSKGAARPKRGGSKS
jgi:hypothetical protein